MNKPNVFKVIDLLRDYRDGDVKDFEFDYNYVFYIDVDGKMSGDHLVLTAIKLLDYDIRNHANVDGGWRTLAVKFAEYTGIPYDHVIELGSCTRGPLPTARDVAETLFNYLRNDGAHSPSWAWLMANADDYAEEDDDEQEVDPYGLFDY